MWLIVYSSLAALCIGTYYAFIHIHDTDLACRYILLNNIKFIYITIDPKLEKLPSLKQSTL